MGSASLLRQDGFCGGRRVSTLLIGPGELAADGAPGGRGEAWTADGCLRLSSCYRKILMAGGWPHQGLVESAGDVAFETGNDLLCGQFFGGATPYVGAGVGVVAHAGDDDHVECAVGLAVAAAVKPPPHDRSGPSLLGMVRGPATSFYASIGAHPSQDHVIGHAESRVFIEILARREVRQETARLGCRRPSVGYTIADPIPHRGPRPA
jgi:hypothetical protein